MGPVQLKVPPPGLAVSNKFEPAHSVELLPAVGAAGVVLTLTAITVAELPHPDTFTDTE